MITRRDFLKLSGAGILSLYVASRGKFILKAQAAIPGGTLEPDDVDKYVTPMLIPPAMPRAGKVKKKKGKNIDYYEIAVRQFQQQILPAGHPATTVWGYGPVTAQNGPAIFNAPSLTIEAKHNRPVRVKWINELKDADGNYLPHLLPVDPTLHWANPPGGNDGRDMRPDLSDKMYVPTTSPDDPLESDEYTRYWGPVPIVTHVHGAVGVGEESDGYAEAWYLPDAANIPAGYATGGTWYQTFAGKAQADFGETWGPGFSTFQFPNKNRASTIWYHDHSLGMTRLNVYAGPAGFYIIRGGPDDMVLDFQTGLAAVLPGPAPALGDVPGTIYYEIPIAIQDRSFNSNGSLFYPDTREFFDDYDGEAIPETDLSPIWNPEFFGNMIMVNGNTWPFQTVEQRRYRIRFLNGCQSRFLILDFNQIPGVEVWAIGNEGGFLAAPVNLTATNGNRLLMGLAERADLIVDFTNVPEGNYVLANVGPDEPFGGGTPVLPPDEPEEQEGEFVAADPDSTGQIMQFRVGPAIGLDPTTHPQFLQLPAITPLPVEKTVRPLALLEVMSDFHEGPAEAVLGNVAGDMAVHKMWSDPVSETPMVGDTEIWEFYNFTADAHPMHVHEVVFEVIDRQAITFEEGMHGPTNVALVPGTNRPPESWESGFKDTVIAYPGEVTRIKAKFEVPGLFVWHCHIVEHEDNEMMRPYQIVPFAP